MSRHNRGARQAAMPAQAGPNSQEAINNFLKFIASLLGSLTGVVTAWLSFKSVLKGGIFSEGLKFALLVFGIILVWICLFYLYTKFVIKKSVVAILHQPLVSKWIGRLALFGLIALPVLSLTGLPYYKLYRSKYNAEQDRKFVRLGNIYFNEGKLDLAIDNYNKALTFSANDAFAYHDLGEAYIHQGDLDKGLEATIKCIELMPDKLLEARARVNLGVIYKKKGDVERAFKENKLATDLDPNISQAYNNIGRIYLEKKNFDLAITNFDRAISLKPNLAFAYNNRGQAKLEKGDMAGALKDINTSLDLDSNNAYAYLNRGRVFQAQGDKLNAVADFLKAVNLAKDADVRRDARNFLDQLGVHGN